MDIRHGPFHGLRAGAASVFDLVWDGDGIISQRYPAMSPLPGGGPMQAGETWYFQGWFRDSGSSNFTDGIQLVMR